MQETVIPFDSGQHQGIDKRLLPSGTFALLENGQLDRDGRIRSRPGFSAIAATTYGSGTHVAYDLATYNDRLLALGDRLSKGFPTDLFEYTQGAGAAAWRPTTPDVDVIRLPRATRVRDVGSPPEQAGGTENMGCAASAGFATLVYNDSDNGAGYAHVFRPDTNQTFCFKRYPGTGNEPMLDLQAVGLDASVVVVGLNEERTQVSCAFFAYASSEDFGTAVTGVFTAGSGIIEAFAVTRVAGLDQWALVTVTTNGNIDTRRVDNTGTVVVPSSSQYTMKDVASDVTTSLAIEADSASNTITIAAVVSDAIEMHTYNLTTGADVGTGPFEPSGTNGETVERVALCRRSSTALCVLADVTSDTDPSVYLEDYTPSTNAFSNPDILRGALLASAPIEHGGEIVFAVRYGDANKHEGPNLLLGFSPSGGQDNRVTPLVAKDLETADSTSVHLPSLVLDSSTSKYYWANGIINAGESRPGTVNESVDVLPVVTELELGAADRRQCAQMGNCLYIAGGVGTYFDGRQLFETGFHARPRILSITPAESTSGALIQGADYDYRLIWEALDSDRNLVKSAVSAIRTVTMGAATLTGFTDINPPVSSLNGLSLVLRDSAGTIDVCTFGSGDTTEATILATINLEITVGITATVNDAHQLVLTATGTNTSIEVMSGSAHAALGLVSKTVYGATPGEDPTQNALVCATPHSMRYNVGAQASGGSVRLKAYRTQATVSRTFASQTGLASVDPPTSSLDGLNLFIFIDDSGTSAMLQVTFDSGSTTQAAIITDINAVTTGRVVASDAGSGRIKLTAVESGEGVFLTVAGAAGDAAGILGFVNGVTVEGTTRFTKGENFQLCAVAHIGANTRTGAAVTITDTLSDQDLESQEILYTSVDSPLGNHAPPPHDYVWRGRGRMGVAGQPQRDRFTLSKLQQPSQPVNFANDGILGFSDRVSGDIQGIVIDAESTMLLTRRQIWQITGEGPQLNGSGEFAPPDEIATRGLKLDGWRSLVKCDAGVFFQLADDRIYVAKGGSIEWIGQPVRDTLASNPVITAACYVAAREAVVFACQTTNGSSGVLLVYDLRRNVWSQDSVGAVSALAEYDGRLAYVQAGVVYLEDAAPGSGTFVPLTVTLGSFTGHGPGGWGTMHKLMLLGVYRGDCNVEAQISYNDGRSWTTLGDFDVTAANGYTADDPFELEFAPAVNNSSRFAFRFLVTSDSDDSEGAWLIALTLYHSKSQGPARKGSASTR